jgi:hypothetical protein
LKKWLIKYLFTITKIYNLLNESSFFGLKEFFSLYLIIEQIKRYNLFSNYQKFNSIEFILIYSILRLDFRKLENYWDQFAQVDFEDYKEDIKEYIVRNKQTKLTFKIYSFTLFYWRNRKKTKRNFENYKK